MGCLLAGVLLAAPLAMAQPADGFGWLDWLGGAWSSLLEAVGVTAESGTEEEPEPVPPKGDEPTSNTNSCPTCGGGEGDSLPGLDPDGKP